VERSGVIRCQDYVSTRIERGVNTCNIVMFALGVKIASRKRIAHCPIGCLRERDVDREHEECPNDQSADAYDKKDHTLAQYCS